MRLLAYGLRLDRFPGHGRLRGARLAGHVRLLKQSGALWLDRICGGALLALAGSLALYRRASA
jgi:hypothetical protein